MSQMEATRRFMVMQPPTFIGQPNVMVVENWLSHVKRILEGLDILENRKVNLTMCMLIAKVDFW